MDHTNVTFSCGKEPGMIKCVAFGRTPGSGTGKGEDIFCEERQMLFNVCVCVGGGSGHP